MTKIFERALAFVRELSERFCRKINELLFSDEKIAALIRESLDTHLSSGNELDSGVNIEYNFIDEFSPEDTASVEEQEKGSTAGELLATTSLYEADDYYIVFALKSMKNFAFKFPPWRAKKEIQDIAKHEAFHVRQYHYICKEGGMEAIDRLTNYMSTVDYNDNIFELGAYLYQWFGEKHDFETDFDPFIHPENYPDEVEQSAA